MKCYDCGKESPESPCPDCHEIRTRDHVALTKAEFVVMEIEKKYGLPSGEPMKKVIHLFKKPNFNFAWGSGPEGEDLRKMVIDGMKRHNLKDIAPYIRHCIKQTSQHEQKTK